MKSNKLDSRLALSQQMERQRIQIELLLERVTRLEKDLTYFKTTLPRRISCAIKAAEKKAVENGNAPPCI